MRASTLNLSADHSKFFNLSISKFPFICFLDFGSETELRVRGTSRRFKIPQNKLAIKWRQPQTPPPCARLPCGAVGCPSCECVFLRQSCAVCHGVSAGHTAQSVFVCPSVLILWLLILDFLARAFAFELSEGCDRIARECVAGLRTHGLRLRKRIKDSG